MKRWSKASRREVSTAAMAARTARMPSALLVLALMATPAATPLHFRTAFALDRTAERIGKARRQRERTQPTGFVPRALGDSIPAPERPEPMAPSKRIRKTKEWKARARHVKRAFRPLVPAPTPVVTFEDAPFPVFGQRVAVLKARRPLIAKERRFLRGALTHYGLRPTAPWFARARIEFQFGRECYVAVYCDRGGETRHAAASVTRQDWRGALTSLAASMQRNRTGIDLPVLKRHG